MPVLDRLIGYFGVAFFLAIITRVLVVRRQIGKSPVVTYGGTGAHDFWHGVLAVIIVLEGMSIVQFRSPALAALLNDIGLFMPFAFLRNPLVEVLGLAVAVGGLMLSVGAQVEMGKNWRIGNDVASATELVSSGLYARSRNPIYVGFIVIATGLFLAMPNAVTLLSAMLTPLALSRIVRMEEECQRVRHGAAFDAYAARVPRWI